MASLPDSLRRRLERTVVEAREVAEAGARAAIERLAVSRSESFAAMAPAERELRVQLRAHARQLGNARKESGEQGVERLVVECAYEHWHRMLFARFLADNRLLIHPEHGVPVTLAECEELAAEAGEKDGWRLAGRFAARMLPAIFRPDDPVLSVRFAPEHQQALEALLAGLPDEVFTADDSLGWVYQFWQTKRKDEVNKSGKKIGADELPAVTQLFTEPYMVQFLLHNTLGAWWAGKVLATRPELVRTAASEEELRRACALPGYEWTYLRFVRAVEGDPWRPAAGSSEGWPERASDITILDPCCGSGHFLVEAFRILVSMRIVEDAISAREACDAVLRDNLFGLEIDERCTQIAAFNLALAAWSYPDAGGYRSLPELHIACSGLEVGAKEEEWLKLAGNDDRLREGMRRLYRLFRQAPTLGSLIDPKRERVDLLTADFDALRPLLEQALTRDDVKRDAQATETGIVAQGMAKAAGLLSRSYTVVVTNVPYLGGHKQDEVLAEFIDERYRRAGGNLANAFLLRLKTFVVNGGTIAAVTPQDWMLGTRYGHLRTNLLPLLTARALALLGAHAFETISGEVVKVALSVWDNVPFEPDAATTPLALDAHQVVTPGKKAATLSGADVLRSSQSQWLSNPKQRITVEEVAAREYLSRVAKPWQGVKTSDDDRFVRCFWETTIDSRWRPFLRALGDDMFSGREHLLLWEDGAGQLRALSAAQTRDRKRDLQGLPAWGRPGVVINTTGRIVTGVYCGEAFASEVVVLTVEEAYRAAVLAYASSEEFVQALRRLDKRVSITTSTFSQVPFDLNYWQAVANRVYADGVPVPRSDDPTQWLFNGNPRSSRSPLHVGVARLLGYRWPRQAGHEFPQSLLVDSDGLEAHAVEDGIICLVSVRGEETAADRLRGLLAHAYGRDWSASRENESITAVGFEGRTLNEWLRDGFFEQHCELFHQRPFMWHIWDGRRRDGFGAFVNYHKLDRRLLERLTYDLLGDWIAQQRQGVKAGERGSEDRLAAAHALQQKLALILEGEPPQDIFVRWKPLREHPIGWKPDLNDGVRINIRPFVEAGVLRRNPKIQWAKDRGSDPESLRPKTDFPWFWKGGRFTGERVNDVHLTSAEKRAAHERTAGRRTGR
jgi:hypothetical protein